MNSDMLLGSRMNMLMMICTLMDVFDTLILTENQRTGLV